MIVKHWYEKPIRVFDLALEDPYGQWLDRWTAKELIATVREINANVLDMMIVNEWGQAYFNARLLPPHPQLDGGDRLAEVLEEAHKHDVKVTGMWGPTPNPIVYERHPDWAKRSRDGQISGWGYRHLDPCVHVCHNSPYGDIVLETLDELFQGYPIDGVAFDYFVGGPCYCSFCRGKFLKETGLDLREWKAWTEPETRAFSDWAAQDADDFVHRATQVARQHDRVIVGWARTSDVIFAEPHTGGMITLKDKGFEIRQITARSRVEGKPTVICTPYSHLYYVGMPKPVAHVRQEFREIIVSGASPWPVIWDWELVKDRRGLAGLGTVFSEARDHEEYLEDTDSFKHAALLVSHQTLALFEDEAYRHRDPVKGWYDALTRAHIPVDVVFDDEITPEHLAAYRVLLLANAASLSDAQAQAVAEFVSQGGGLVASFQTSLYDQAGYHRWGFALKAVFGCEFQAIIDVPWTYIGLTGEHPVNDGFDDGFLLLHGEMNSLDGYLNPEQRGQAELRLRGITLDARHQVKVAPSEGSQVIATVFDSAKPLGSYFIKDLAPAIPGKDTGYPGIIVNIYGNGKVVYFPGQVDRLFYRIGHPDYERLLLNSLRFVGGTPSLVVKAPTTVEATFFRQPQHNRVIVHLLNHTYDQLYPAPATGQYGGFSREVFRPIGDIVPVSGIQVSLHTSGKDRVKRILSLGSSQELPFSTQGDVTQCGVPTLGEYDMLVIDYADQTPER